MKNILIVAFFLLSGIVMGQTTGYVLKRLDGSVDLPNGSITPAMLSEAISGTNYRTLVTLNVDVTNNNAVANTIQDVTGLSFNVTAGTTYRFQAIIPYTSAATTTGSRWTISAPNATLLNYTSAYTLTSTAQTVNYATAINVPAATNATSLTAGNLAIITGIIIPSQNGTVQIRFASEVANSAIVAKAGASLEYW